MSLIRDLFDRFMVTRFEFSLEGLTLKLKLQYFGHLMWRANSLEKTLDARKDWGQEEKGVAEDEMVGWHHWFSGHEFEQTPWDSDREAWHAAVHGVSKESDTTKRLNNKQDLRFSGCWQEPQRGAVSSSAAPSGDWLLMLENYANGGKQVWIAKDTQKTGLNLAMLTNLEFISGKGYKIATPLM